MAPFVDLLTRVTGHSVCIRVISVRTGSITGSIEIELTASTYTLGVLLNERIETFCANRGGSGTGTNFTTEIGTRLAFFSECVFEISGWTDIVTLPGIDNLRRIRAL